MRRFSGRMTLAGIITLALAGVTAIILIAIGGAVLRVDGFLTAALFIYGMTLLRVEGSAFPYMGAIVGVVGTIIIVFTIVAYSLVVINGKINDLKELRPPGTTWNC